MEGRCLRSKILSGEKCRSKNLSGEIYRGLYLRSEMLSSEIICLMIMRSYYL